LSKPLKKNQSGGFDEIELEQAMDEIGSKLAAIRQQYGPAAIGVWTDEDLDAGQNKEAAHRLAYALGSPNYFSSDSQYMASRAMSMSMVYGNYGSPDIANSRLLIIWGANPPFANPIKMQAINEARSKGAKLVVIDPCYTEIARQADLYIAIRPGTDGALAWGIIKEMLERGIVDYPFIKEFTLGFEQLQAYAVEFTRERVAEITDVNGDAIKQIVDLIAKAAPACCNYLGTGVEQHLNGSNTIRAIAFIDVLAGSIDRLGGVKLPEALGNATLLDDCECQQLRSLEPVGADVFPVFYEKTTAGHTSTLADQIVSAKPYPIKALILSAANPLLTNAATSRVQEALSALELLVVKDLFLTETAQLADYVIPAASWLERVEIVANPAENALFYADKCLDYGLQTEYQFYKGLA
ncbi:MAG: molybdopterin-dependent oxidoreductase, partial [Clostridiales bacterium]